MIAFVEAATCHGNKVRLQLPGGFSMEVDAGHKIVRREP